MFEVHMIYYIILYYIYYIILYLLYYIILYYLFIVTSLLGATVIELLQDGHLSQTGRATLHVVENFATSLFLSFSFGVTHAPFTCQR